MSRKIYIYAAGIAMSLAVFTGCGGPAPLKTSDSSGSEMADQPAFNVRTAPVTSGALSSHIDLSGDVEASVSVDIFPDTAGKLTEILVEPGSSVREGDILGWVDPARPGMNYAASPVKASISGTITAVNADPGATVSPQTPLFKLGNIDDLVVITQVPERFLYLVKQGQTAEITTTAAPGRTFRAEISRLSPVVNPTTRTLQVELSLVEASPVKAGMFVGIRLITSTEENALMVPEKALVRRSGETFVFRVKGETVEKVDITIGLESAGSVEILSGLERGDRVVTEGASLLSPGSRVKIIDGLSLKTPSEGARS
jgi:multidrug efflux pump subunit AcrA (membrane-fusion protein)